MTRNKLYIFILLITVLCSRAVIAQPYGNEWIDQNQRYFKINIGEDGIYRLTKSELENFGFPVSTVDPRKIQIFHLGQELAIKVEGQLNGVFDQDDYVEFYAKAADGTTDTPLYTVTEAQPHTYHSLFTDSSAYFMTYKINSDLGSRLDDFFENNVTGIPADNYYIDRSLRVLTNVYYEGKSYSPNNEVLLPTYDYGEGWTGSFAKRGQSLTYTLTGLTNRVEDDVDPLIKVLLVGGNNNQHNVSIQVGASTSSLRTIATAEFNADENYLVTESIAWSDFSTDGNLVVRAIVNGVDGSADRVSISYLDLNYSRAFDVANANSSTFQMKTNPTNKSYIEVSNSPSQIILYDITDNDSPIDIGINESSGSFTAVVPNTSTARILLAQSGVKQVGNFTEIFFQAIDATKFDYLMIGHKDLHGNTSSGQGDQIEAYKNYRNSVSGGSHKVLSIDIDQVFDQFNYGNPSPIAIRNFTKYMYDKGDPRFLFMIGKASNVQDNYYRQDPNLTEIRHKIPTYGYPGGDVPFTEGFDGKTVTSSIATGRINATTPNHIEAYLNKVVEEEAIPINTLRQKHLIHLSGGGSENELIAFRAFIDGFADTAGGRLLGGASTQISKSNNNAVELINISDEVNEGAVMVTFFGHSSGTITDIEIGLVSDPSFGYSNKGKYPVFLVNGCSAGDFFSNIESFGVDWVLTPDLGATAFMAHSATAFSNQLKRYTDLFYQVAFTDNSFIARSVGEVKLEASKRYMQTYGISPVTIGQVQLVNLQGDPAVKIFGPDKPNFDINEDLLRAQTFDGSQLLASVDSFYLEMNIKNYGIYSDQNFFIGVDRTFADGSTKSYGPIGYDKLLNQDTIKFTIANDVANPEGKNTFLITLDPLNLIEEMDKSNNTATLEVFLSAASTVNLFPKNYATQTESTIDFFYQSSDMQAGSRAFELEIDTTTTFNSPFLIKQTNTQSVLSKSTVDINPSGNIQNGTVFYWRTRFANPLPSEDNDWIVSSFVLDASKSEGWQQKNIEQLAGAVFNGLIYNPSTDLWEFENTQVRLEVENYGSRHPSGTYEDTQILLNGRNYFITNSEYDNGCRNNTINFLAMDRQSLVPFKAVKTPGFDIFNPLVCGLIPQVIYNYAATDIDGIYGPEVFINNIDNGDHVLIFSLGKVEYSTWSSSLIDQMVSLGIDRSTLENLDDDEPIIFLGAKNSIAGSAIEIRTLNLPKNEEQLNLNKDVLGFFDSGEVSSPIIGPATSWSEAAATITPSSNPSQDQQLLQIFGLDQTKNETLLFESASEMTFDLSTVNAEAYPFLKIHLELIDEVQFSPAQLKAWDVSYQSTPEGALLVHDAPGISTPIQRQEGEELTANFTYWNYSKYDFPDSIKINFDLLSLSTGNKVLDSIQVAPIKAGDSVNFSLKISTIGKIGSNALILNTNKNFQNEVYTFNNGIKLPNYLEVIADETNPLVDISFDGVQLMDGDLVSPTPSIQINISDDNSFLLMEDTVGINFYIKASCLECEYERISFSSPEVTWEAASDVSAGRKATDSNKKFKIQYNPQKFEDGTYSIRILANDVSGNPSGLKPVEVSFEVINESTITNFYPYPNPFSSSTRFVFTLTGSEIPEDIKIQIMTVTGRVVREIFMDELGTINIGNNISDYAWDGRDNYGDQLANGVYLYRVQIKSPGENFKQRETAGDKGFKNGFGKLYLLR